MPYLDRTLGLVHQLFALAHEHNLVLVADHGVVNQRYYAGNLELETLLLGLGLYKAIQLYLVLPLDDLEAFVRRMLECRRRAAL